MKDIIFLICITLILCIIGIKSHTIAGYFGYIIFKRYDICTSKEIYNYVEEIKRRMNLSQKVMIAVNDKKKNPNAYVCVYNDTIYIILHCKDVNDDFIKFAICHELSHIKLKHREAVNNMFFYMALCLVFILLGKVIVVAFQGQNYIKYIINIEYLYSKIIVIIGMILIPYGNYKYHKDGKVGELEADYIASKYTGLDIAIKSISLLYDKPSKKDIFDSHPSNNERIEYLRSKYKIGEL